MSTNAIAAQITEADRTVREREHLHPILIEKGRLKKETSAAQILAMQAIARTLRWLEDNRDWIYAVHAQRLEMERQRDNDQALIEEHPAVRAVLDGLPDTEIANVRPIEQESEHA